MIFKTWLSDLNDVALALDKVKTITQFNTGSSIANGLQLSEVAINKYKTSIDGLSLSQAQAVLSATALNNKQKEQVLIAAGLIQSKEAITLAQVKELAASKTLSAQKKEEVLTTLQGAYAEDEWNDERLEAIALAGGEAGEIAKVIMAKKAENAENVKSIASGKSLLAVLKQQIAALASNPLTWVGIGLAGLAISLYKTSEAIGEVADKAQELSDTFNQGKTDINNYKSKIEDLYDVINDSESSLEEVTTARETLMTVQDELINKFGDEKETIDLITQAINGQSDALDVLTQKQWQATKNEFNQSDFWNNFGNWKEGYATNIDRMVDTMENAWGNIKLSPSDYFGGEYDDVINKLEKSGWKYSSSSETFVKGGSVEDLYEEILEIQTLVGQDMPDNFLNSLTKYANKLKTTLDSYESMWDAYILNDKIFGDENLANSWNAVNEAYKTYKKAVSSGEKETIEAAMVGFATSINKVLDDENVSNSVKDYFEDMYPSLYRDVEKWEFKVNILPKESKDRLSNFTREDILKAIQSDEYSYVEAKFNSILSLAEDYGIVTGTNTEKIQQLLTLLEEWGIIQKEITEDTPVIDETKFSISEDEAKELSEYQSKIDSISSSLSNLGNLTASEITDIMAEFGDEKYGEIFQKWGVTGEAGVGNLKAALLEIATIVKETAKKEVPELTKAIEEMFGVITNPKGDTTQLRKEFNELRQIYDDISAGQTMNMDEATELINQYPELADAVKVVGDAYSFEEDAIISLVNAKITELNEASSYEYQTTQDAIKLVKDRIAAYEAEVTALNTIRAVKGLNASLDNKDTEKKLLLKDDGVNNVSHDEYLASLKELARLEELLQKLEENFKIEEINDSTSEFSDEIDWAAHSVSVLEEKVSDLERVFDNAKGYEAQKEALQDVNEELVNLKTGYENAAKAYRDDYEKALSEISDEDLRNKIRHAIESGERFDIEAYVGADDEELHKDINEAIDAYNNLTDAENNVIEVGIKLDENALKQLELDLEKSSAIVSLTEARLNRSDYTDATKNELYDHLISDIGTDYQNQINEALYNKDFIKAEQLRVEWAQKLIDIEQERLDLIRAQEDTVIEELDIQHEILEAEIERNDGIGTREQYLKSIENREKVQENLLKSLEREKKKLEEIEKENGKNSEEYRAQSSIVIQLIRELLGVQNALQGIRDELGNLVKNDIDEAIGNLDEQIEDVNEGLDDLNKQLEQMDTIISGAVAYIQDQIDAQEELKKPIEEQLEAMQKANDERERALALDKARYELERAQSQRTVKLYSGEEKGFIYTQDYEAVRDAQENLSNLEYEEAVHQLEQQLEYYDKIIADLQEIQDAWSNVAKNAQDALDIQKAMAALGTDGIMSIDVAKSYELQYQGLLAAVESAEKQIEELEERQKTLDEFWEKYKAIIAGFKDHQDSVKADNEFRTLFDEYREMLELEFPDNPATALTQGWLDITKEVHGMETLLSDLLGRMEGAMDEFAHSGYEDLEGSLTEIVDIMEDFFETEFNYEEGALDGVFDDLTNDVSELRTILNDMSQWGWTTDNWFDEGKTLEGMLAALMEIDPDLAELVTKFENGEHKVSELNDELANTGDTAKESIPTTEEVLGGLNTTLGELNNTLATLVAEIQGADETISTDVDETTTGIEDAVNDTNDVIVDSTEKAMDEITTALGDGTSDQLKVIDDYADAVNLAIKDMCDDLSKTVTDSFSALNIAIATLGQNIADQMASIVQNAMNNIAKIQNGGEEVVKGVKSTTTGLSGLNQSSTPNKSFAKYHTGLEQGLVGEKNSGEGIKTLGLRKLEPDEIPAVLKVNEAVLTELQQKNVLSNMGAAYQAGMNSTMGNLVSTNRNAQVSVGDINITCPGVTSQQVMNQIGTELHKHFGNFALDALQISNKR